MTRSAFILLGIGVGQLAVWLCCAPVGDGLSSLWDQAPSGLGAPRVNPSQGGAA